MNNTELHEIKVNPTKFKPQSVRFVKLRVGQEDADGKYLFTFR